MLPNTALPLTMLCQLTSRESHISDILFNPVKHEAILQLDLSNLIPELGDSS